MDELPDTHYSVHDPGIPAPQWTRLESARHSIVIGMGSAPSRERLAEAHRAGIWANAGYMYRAAWPPTKSAQSEGTLHDLSG